MLTTVDDDAYTPALTEPLTARFAGASVAETDLARSDDEDPPTATLSMVESPITEGDDFSVTVTFDRAVRQKEFGVLNGVVIQNDGNRQTPNHLIVIPKPIDKLDQIWTVQTPDNNRAEDAYEYTVRLEKAGIFALERHSGRLGGPGSETDRDRARKPAGQGDRDHRDRPLLSATHGTPAGPAALEPGHGA